MQSSVSSFTPRDTLKKTKKIFCSEDETYGLMK